MKNTLIEHKNLDLRKKPFSIKAHPDVIGRVKEKELLTRFIKNGDICFLTGPAGSGKSSLLLWLAKNLKQHNVFYIDATSVESSFSIKEFLKKSRKGFSKFRSYPKNSVILLDESQDCDTELQKALKMHWDHDNIKSIVITQIDQKLESFSISFKDRIGNRVIKLGKLSSADAINLIESRYKKTFDRAVIKKIIKKASNRPRKILELCELLYIYNKSNNKFKLFNVKKTLKKEKPNIKVISEDNGKLKIQENEVFNNPQEYSDIYEINEGKKILTLLQKNIVLSLKNGCATLKEVADNLGLPLKVIENEFIVLCECNVIVKEKPLDKVRVTLAGET